MIGLCYVRGIGGCGVNLLGLWNGHGGQKRRYRGVLDEVSGCVPGCVMAG